MSLMLQVCTTFHELINVKQLMNEFNSHRTTCVLVLIVRLDQKTKHYEKMYDYQKHALASLLQIRKV